MDSLGIRAEQALLGAVLLDPASQQHVLGLVKPGDFGRPWHGQVLAAMRRVQARGGVPGPAEVYTELQNDSDLPRSVSQDAVPLVTWMEAAPQAGHVEAYAGRRDRGWDPATARTGGGASDPGRPVRGGGGPTPPGPAGAP